MRKILFYFLLLPFVLIAESGNCHLEQTGGGDWRIVCEGSGLEYNYIDVTNEVYTIADCEGLKSALLSSMDSINQNAWRANNLRTSIETDYNILYADDYFSTNSLFMSTLNSSQAALDSMGQELFSIISATGSDFDDNLYSKAANISCGSCPTNGASGGGSGGSGGGSCCDFTPIVDRLISVEKQMVSTSNQIARIQFYFGAITNQLSFNNFLLEHGFHDVTNQLQLGEMFLYDFFPGDPIPFSYWISGPELIDWEYDSGTFGDPLSNWSSPLGALYSLQYGQSYLLASIASWQKPSYEQISELSSGVSVLTNELSLFRQGFSTYADVTTNALTALTDSTTNFFSFFYQATAPSEGVIADYTVQEADGTYFTFLTNYYITVNEGGSLTGMLVDKTNWFYRVEALLAALVFADAPSTNVVDVDSDEYDKQKNQLEEMFDELNGSLDEPMESLTELNDNMIESLSKLSESFSSAAVPSHIELLSVSEDSGSGSLSKSSTSFDVEFMVENEINDLFEIFHSLTTLAWLFLSLLVIYKFLVWSINKAVLVIRFIWNVAEMFMSRNG